MPAIVCVCPCETLEPVVREFKSVMAQERTSRGLSDAEESVCMFSNGTLSLFSLCHTSSHVSQFNHIAHNLCCYLSQLKLVWVVCASINYGLLVLFVCCNRRYAQWACQIWRTGLRGVPGRWRWPFFKGTLSLSLVREQMSQCRCACLNDASKHPVRMCQGRRSLQSLLLTQLCVFVYVCVWMCWGGGGEGVGLPFRLLFSKLHLDRAAFFC